MKTPTPLTDEQIEHFEAICVDPVDASGWGFLNRIRFARAIEAAVNAKWEALMDAKDAELIESARLLSFSEGREVELLGKLAAKDAEIAKLREDAELWKFYAPEVAKRACVTLEHLTAELREAMNAARSKQ